MGQMIRKFDFEKKFHFATKSAKHGKEGCMARFDAENEIFGCFYHFDVFVCIPLSGTPKIFKISLTLLFSEGFPLILIWLQSRGSL